jgi:hypothetical protein
MVFNKSIVQYAVLMCFGEPGYAVGHELHLAPGEPAAEWDSFPFRTLANLGDTLLPKLLTRELSLVESVGKMGKGS